MPRPARLEPYRAWIQDALDTGEPAALVRKRLEAEHGITVPDSTWFDFVKKLHLTDVPDSPDTAALAQAPLQVSTFTALLTGTAGELTDRFAQVIEGVQQLKAESDARYGEVAALLHSLEPARVTDTLARHTAAFEALLQRLEATACWRTRLRMALHMGLVTGAAWGLVVWRILAR